MKTVVGLDLSLTATGLAKTDPDAGYALTTITLKITKDAGHLRLQLILDSIAAFTQGAALVVVEGPAFGAKGQAYHQLAGLWWLAKHQLWQANLPVAVANPMHVKAYATGTTKAGKDAMMLATARRFPDFNGDNNGADAMWLCAMGCDYLGQPPVVMPAAYRGVLSKVEWPQSVGAQ